MTTSTESTIPFARSSTEVASSLSLRVDAYIDERFVQAVSGRRFDSIPPRDGRHCCIEGAHALRLSVASDLLGEIVPCDAFAHHRVLSKAAGLRSMQQCHPTPPTARTSPRMTRTHAGRAFFHHSLEINVRGLPT